ncbi:MAG: YqeG family HAD IIIA-type phosphatase [Lachnospiraceae bacterium]|nr:YqeG family HAD IIIA-type phosphatase [Lachnospiraceae bacterium]
MLRELYPSAWTSSPYDIDYRALYRIGIRGVIFDIDNTLVPHGAPADDRAEALMERIRTAGIDICFLSNNGKERVESFNRNIGAHFVYKAGKPKREGYRKAMSLMGTDESSTVFIGDQIFTDVWGANRSGIRSILVKQIGPKEEIQIILKRRLEWIVLAFYRIYRKSHGPAISIKE